MKITLICVGKIKEKYFQMAIDEYLKRIGKYIKIEIIEVIDEKIPDNCSEAQMNIVKEKEGERIKRHIKEGDYIAALDIVGKKIDSEEMASFINNSMLKSVNALVFVIGGSLGLSKKILEFANLRLSFSDLTFPHQLMRVILLEQIYRSFKIIKNEPYHK